MDINSKLLPKIFLFSMLLFSASIVNINFTVKADTVFTVSGCVLFSGVPASGFNVYLIDDAEPLGYCATDSNGQFTIPDVPAGTHNLNLVKGGDIDYWTSVRVTGNLDLGTINFGIVSGYILLSDGSPAPTSISVRLGNGVWSTDDFAVVNSAGHFALYGVPAGTYTLSVHDYYVHKDEFYALCYSTQVSVNGDLELDDIFLPAVSGYVLDSEDSGVVGAMVCLIIESDGISSPFTFDSVYTDSNGHYVFSVVPYGSYTVQVFGPSGVSDSSPMPVTISGETVLPTITLIGKPFVVPESIFGALSSLTIYLIAFIFCMAFIAKRQNGRKRR